MSFENFSKCFCGTLYDDTSEKYILTLQVKLANSQERWRWVVFWLSLVSHFNEALHHGEKCFADGHSNAIHRYECHGLELCFSRRNHPWSFVVIKRRNQMLTSVSAGFCLYSNAKIAAQKAPRSQHLPVSCQDTFNQEKLLEVSPFASNAVLLFMINPVVRDWQYIFNPLVWPR